MSTDLYGVRVLDVDNASRRVRFTIFVVYYDTAAEYHQPLLDEPSFFVRFLDEPYGSGTALADEQRLLDEDWVDSNAWRFIESVTRLATRNEPVTDWAAYADFYYEREGTWENEDKLVQADFDVVFTDVKWMAHFQKGNSWGTTAYPTQADLPGRAAEVLPDLRREVRHIVPFSGEREEATPEDVMFTSDGKLLAVISQAGAVVVYDTATWAETMRGQIATTWAQAEILPNSHVLVVRDGDAGQVAGWNAETGESVSIELPPGLARSPSGLFRGFYGREAGLQLYDEQGTALHVIGPDQHIERAAFHPNDEVVATVGMEPEITFWRISDGAPLRTLSLEAKRVMFLGWSPDGRWLSLSDGDVASVLDGETGIVTRRSKRRGGIPIEMAWSERYVASLWVGEMGYGGYVAIFEIGASETKPETIVMEAPVTTRATKVKKPVANKPAANKPPAKKAAANKPAANKPPAKKAAANKPAAKKAAANKPAAKKSAAKQPAAKQAVVKQAVVNKAAANKAAANKAAANKPAAKKSAAKKAAAKKPAAKKPAAKKPAARKTAR